MGLIEVDRDDPSGLISALKEIEDQVRAKGLFAFGYLSYQAARGIDAAMAVPGKAEMPLLSFRLYRSLRLLHHPPSAVPPDSPTTGGEFSWRSPSFEDYHRGFRRIRTALKAGDSYQVNYTLRFFAERTRSIINTCTGRMAKSMGYFGRYFSSSHGILSLSPELFFQKNDDVLLARPMKGTAPRGLNPEADRKAREGLKSSEKNRAENLMIVDMIRNDMGRIAAPGSVSVPELFVIETYPYVHQMVSLVRSRTRAPVSSILEALFPSASITGAPKIKTMELISEIEESSRDIYTGSLGLLYPNGDALFNVAIRTLWWRQSPTEDGAELCYGAGGGIIWDSDLKEEWEELQLKLGAVR